MHAHTNTIKLKSEKVALWNRQCTVETKQKI
uniref:Uncharacterized protein n=1 Tax=Anguilla anguilla TaxID=7936 RepID=A0A0E9PM42_ANGAN